MKLILILTLFISGFCLGQNPTNYQYRTVRERLLAIMVDSTFTPPRYNGVPSGLRVGSSTHDGHLAVDTANHHLYLWGNSVWNKLAKYAEIIALSGSQGDLIYYSASNTISN